MTAKGGSKLTKAQLIAQLLKKAETTTPEEAEALTAKAVELMQKYGIDQMMLAARGTDVKERIEQLHIPLTGIYSMAYMSMMSAIARAYGGENIDTYYTPYSKSNLTLTIVGFESDVSALKVLLASLQLQAVVALDSWWKTIDSTHLAAMQKFKERRTFLKSFGYGASERIGKSRDTIVKDAEALTPGTELVLRSRATAIKDFMNTHVGSLKAIKSREKSGSFSASKAGRHAGRNANTGDKQVGQGYKALNV
jgi:hypothetical protein